MDPIDDVDLELLRASANLLKDITVALPRLLYKTSKKESARQVHRYARERDVARILKKLEPFQEDPQLLDAHLKTILPSLVDAYLANLQHDKDLPVRPGTVPIQRAICQILYTICKIRGEKVVIGFFNNEPRYLELLMADLEERLQAKATDASNTSVDEVAWQERYVLLLWLSHQILTPFDLQTISADTVDGLDRKATLTRADLRLTNEVPAITLRIVSICLQCLHAPTRERSAAASLLTRLCLRPDMREAGLLNDVVFWAVASLRVSTRDTPDLHKQLGILTLLTRLTASGSRQEMAPFLSSIFVLCRGVLEDHDFRSLKSSAIARKLVIKSLRCIVVISNQAGSPMAFDVDSALEETISSLLELLADNDSPVRYAASKALSLITMALDAGMASDIVDAILDSFNEDVLITASIRNLSAVDPLRWHGLTLTLGQLIYRRAIANEQLPEVLNALILALNFEQRSAIGTSIGTNVRDAANFGIWAFSRRYTTAEWQVVEVGKLTALGGTSISTTALITERIAIESFLSACLDPAGNIRRGSSAALQELVGRHPNTVTEGIALVQAVDYHAVGLRGRAMSEVAYNVSQLSPAYSMALLEALVGWRGTGAVDVQSRSLAGTAIGRIVCASSPNAIELYVNKIASYLDGTNIRQVEERQGLMSALAAILHNSFEIIENQNFHNLATTKDSSENALCIQFSDLWATTYEALNFEPKCFTSVTLRPELTASAFLELSNALAVCQYQGSLDKLPVAHLDDWLECFKLCLQRPEETILLRVSGAVTSLTRCLDVQQKQELLETCKAESLASFRPRTSGFILALGALHSSFDGINVGNDIIGLLVTKCSAPVDVEARVLALRALQIIVENGSLDMLLSSVPNIVRGVISGLNDYTTNERGDIGSLVRLAALAMIESSWRRDFLDKDDDIYNAVLRLSLERLDKVRLRAVQSLLVSKRQDHAHVKLIKASATATDIFAQDLATQGYFCAALRSSRKSTKESTKRAILTGFVSSAGVGSEIVIQACRAALCDEMTLGATSSDSAIVGDDLSPIDILNMANTLMSLTRDHLLDDRVLVPLLEVWTYILDARTLMILTTATSSFKWRTLFVLVQKSHFKSTNMQKLFLALDLYRGIVLRDDAEVAREGNELDQEVLTKMISMLLHPFPKVRVRAAENLWICRQWNRLKGVDWSSGVESLKSQVAEIKSLVQMETAA